MIDEELDWIDRQWEQMKQEFPIGSKVRGRVFRIEPFGIFLDIGYEVIGGYMCSGLIDIITKSDDDSHGLPHDYSIWPGIGEKLYCKVVWHRDSEKEVSLSIVNKNSNFEIMQLLDIHTPLLNTKSITLHVTREQFDALCHDNPELRLELTATGELIVMPPVSLDSSGKNLDLATDVAIWNRQTKLGKVYDSSGGFTLPNGALKSADVMWLQQSKVDALPPNTTFPEVVPDFVIELRSSKSDSLSKLQEKMIEYRDNGVRLGWLINPQQQKVEIYRIDREVEIMESPSTLSGEDILVGFSLDLRSIFS
jgi:Uma2 family endonuclease/predicted RNA-binding protein with RPS1 domain